MRIGTWNVEGKCTPKHVDLLLKARCDVWLLTEVKDELVLPDFHRHVTHEYMRPDRRVRWAGIFSTQLMDVRPDPHFASAAALIDGTTYCSSILPWSGGGNDAFGPSEGHPGKTAKSLRELLANIPHENLVWGGDWNHSACGPEMAGSMGGRQHVRDAVCKLGLNVPTAGLAHRLDGVLSIDHIAVPLSWRISRAERLVATSLSDHDAYVIELADD